jgi:hypothetical protein
VAAPGGDAYRLTRSLQVSIDQRRRRIELPTKTTTAKPEEQKPKPAESDSEEQSKYPETWRWDEDGDVIEGAYVELSEAHTRFDGATRPILVLEVGGKPRTVWLFHTALQSRLRDELLKRPGNELRVGEPVRIEQLGQKESENGLKYMNYRVEFPESPKRSGLDILGGTDETKTKDVDDDIPF